MTQSQVELVARCVAAERLYFRRCLAAARTSARYAGDCKVNDDCRYVEVAEADRAAARKVVKVGLAEFGCPHGVGGGEGRVFVRLAAANLTDAQPGD